MSVDRLELPSPTGPTAGLRQLLAHALANRGRAARADARAFVAPLYGGGAALLRAADSRRLVTRLEPAPEDSPTGRVRELLERRQARRSALLLAPRRDVAVSFAMRWNLDLARIRIVEDTANPTQEQLERFLGASGGHRAWHSAA